MLYVSRFFRLWAVLVPLSVPVFTPCALARHAKHRQNTAEQAAEAPQLLAIVADPKPNEICFSPDEPCGAKLIKFVQGAQKSLDLAIYDINIDQLVHHLALKSRKIPVRILVDNRQSKGDHSLVNLLVRGGLQTRYGRQRGIMHNKFIIRDGTMLETGSFNFTNHAALANNENQLYLDQPEILARYKTRFDKLWSEAQPVTPQAPRGRDYGTSNSSSNSQLDGNDDRKAADD